MVLVFHEFPGLNCTFETYLNKSVKMKKVEIRWRDLDPNRHLANSAFMDYMSQARLDFLKEWGITQKTLEKHQIGPVVFFEHIYYFKEVAPDDPLYVNVELKGMSEDGMFFEFVHNLYDGNGQNMATCKLMGAWIDLKKRKMIPVPKSLFSLFEDIEKPADFRTLTKEDTRKHGVRPQNIEPDF